MDAKSVTRNYSPPVPKKVEEICFGSRAVDMAGVCIKGLDENGEDAAIMDVTACERRRGLFATCSFKKGETVLLEAPLWAMQTLENRHVLLCCARCFRQLGGLAEHIALASGQLSRASFAGLGNGNDSASPSVAASTVLGNPCACGELYCSMACRMADLTTGGHSLLCTAAISDEDAESHPLIRFKLHAMRSNEIFILVGKVFAGILADYQRLRRTGGVDEVALLEAALAPLQHFQQRPWWSVGEVDEELRVVLENLVEESSALFKEALQMSGNDMKIVSKLVTKETFALIVGAFELNLFGLRVDMPVLVEAESLMSREKHDMERSSVVEAFHDIRMARMQGDCDDESCDDESYDDHDQDHNHDHEHNHEDKDENGHEVSSVDEEPWSDILLPLDGSGLFTVGAIINHSCNPSCKVLYTFTETHGLMAKVIALQDIAVGDELSHSYLGDCQHVEFESRQSWLLKYGFVCTCTRCVQEKL